MSELMEQSQPQTHLIDQLRKNFTDEEYRNAYAESFLNSYVAGQIKVLREQFPMTQGELAEKIGTQQPGIARLENVNYSAWKVETLRKLARALQVRLKISFEEWGTLPAEIEGFKKERLVRAPFQKDPVFSGHLALGSMKDRDLAQKKPTSFFEEWVDGSRRRTGAAQAVEVKGLEGVG